MSKINIPNLPVGLDFSSFEFFRTEKFKCKCCNNCNIFDYSETPQSIREIIQAEILKDEKALEILSSFSELNNDSDKIEEAFVSCRFGNYDSIPDFVKNKLTSDCPNCGIENECPGFNIICKIPSINGYNLTPREYQIIKLISRGFSDKEIAVMLDIAVNTAQTHVNNIRKNTDFFSRLRLGLWAKDHNI